jgi:hypothetical protein
MRIMGLTPMPRVPAQITDHRLYQLIRQKDPPDNHTFEIEFPDPGRRPLHLLLVEVGGDFRAPISKFAGGDRLVRSHGRQRVEPGCLPRRKIHGEQGDNEHEAGAASHDERVPRRHFR